MSVDQAHLNLEVCHARRRRGEVDDLLGKVLGHGANFAREPSVVAAGRNGRCASLKGSVLLDGGLRLESAGASRCTWVRQKKAGLRAGAACMWG